MLNSIRSVARVYNINLWPWSWTEIHNVKEVTGPRNYPTSDCYIMNSQLPLYINFQLRWLCCQQKKYFRSFVANQIKGVQFLPNSKSPVEVTKLPSKILNMLQIPHEKNSRLIVTPARTFIVKIRWRQPVLRIWRQSFIVTINDKIFRWLIYKFRKFC